MADQRAWVEVDLGALVRNARAVAARAQVPLVPMVKADAYGLGAVPVAKALEAVEPFAFGVSSIAEGAELREGGITRPIILYSPSVIAPFGERWPHSDLEQLLVHRVTPTLARAEDIVAWAAQSFGRPYHLAIDTGMHRAGAPWTAVEALREAVLAHPPEGVLTHFHSSQLDDGSMQAQEARFADALAELGAAAQFRYTDNSGSIVRRDRSPWDLVRPGVFLYGVGSWQSAVGSKGGLSPEPVVALRARLLEVREVAAGEGVSYDATWRASKPARIATVACGYADGLRRQLGNRACALVQGREAAIRGVVTMDMAMLDVTDIPCAPGDVATFLGRDGDRVLTAESVAALGGLSPYELLVGLRLRLPRFYSGT